MVFDGRVSHGGAPEAGDDQPFAVADSTVHVLPDRSPAFEALHRAVEAYLQVVERDIVPPDFRPRVAEEQDAPIPLRYRRVLDYMLCEPPDAPHR